jgi:hypothetical protein
MSKGILALLDLPVGTLLSINGKAVTLKRNDFVGISALPSNCFHLVTIQASTSLKTDNTHGAETPRHGFILLFNEVLDDNNHGESERIVAHRYDPVTEEVCAAPIDDASVNNLETSIRQGQVEAVRIIPYSKFLTDMEREEWQARATSFITTDLLLSRNVIPGTKIIPGSYQGDDDPVVESPTQVNNMEDGRPLRYPPIPVMENSSSSRHRRRCTRHAGTKRFLSALKPGQRTSLMTAVAVEDEGSTAVILRHVLESCHDNSWRVLLGDIQLSFIVFLNLHCLASLEHWRDLIAMLSFSKIIDEDHMDLYLNFATILQNQMKFMDRDFFDDVEFSGDNFFQPALLRVSKLLLASKEEALRQKGDELQCAAANLFRVDDAHETIHREAVTLINDGHSIMDETDDDDDDDSQGPVVVPHEEYEASKSLPQIVVPARPSYTTELRSKYPILFAAMQPHEDLLMVCARALDTQSDVSLVREAAAYLQNVVEAKHM